MEVSVADYDSAVDSMLRAARDGRGTAATALAVHGLMCGRLDLNLKEILNSFELVFPDGQPVRWALNRLWGARLSDRVYGPELMLRVCEAASAEGMGIYLYGSRPGVNEALASNLKRRFPSLRVAGARPSRFRPASPAEDEEDTRSIRESGARIVFVGLGCPLQERWAFEHRDRLSAVLICVGAAFDFHAGTLKQAPGWMQKRGLEWLYRLLREPRRLWKRYLLLNPLFMLLVGVEIIRARLGSTNRRAS